MSESQSPGQFSVVLTDTIPSDAVDLESCAAACNPHALPAALRGAHTAGVRASTLQCRNRSGDLVGLWPLGTSRPPPGLSILGGPLVPLYDLAGAPLLDAQQATAILSAMLAGLAEGLAPGRALLIRNLQTEGAVWDAFLALQRERVIAISTVETWDRAILDRSAAPTAELYGTQSLSSGTRKRLRAKRRALEDQGSLALVVHDSPEAVQPAFETFLALEAAGWKGRAGTALGQRPGDARYVVSVLRSMAETGRAFMLELRVGERTIGSGLFLRCSGEVFFWKTAYDETLAKESPGVLFDLMLTEWLYAQPWFRRLDTGSDASVDPASLIWKQRRPMANVVISLSPWSVQGRALVAGQKLRRWLKGLKRRVVSA